jgi:hypothetical protein
MEINTHSFFSIVFIVSFGFELFSINIFLLGYTSTYSYGLFTELSTPNILNKPKMSIENEGVIVKNYLVNVLV